MNTSAEMTAATKNTRMYLQRNAKT